MWAPRPAPHTRTVHPCIPPPRLLSRPLTLVAGNTVPTLELLRRPHAGCELDTDGRTPPTRRPGSPGRVAGAPGGGDGAWAKLRGPASPLLCEGPPCRGADAPLRPGREWSPPRHDRTRSARATCRRPVPSPPGCCPEARTDHRAHKHGGLFVTALRSHRFQTEPHEQLRTTQRCSALSDVTTGLPASLPQAGPPAYSCLREHHSASARVCKRSPNYLTPSGKPGMSGASANPPFKRACTATAGGPAQPRTLAHTQGRRPPGESLPHI